MAWYLVYAQGQIHLTFTLPGLLHAKEIPHYDNRMQVPCYSSLRTVWKSSTSTSIFKTASTCTKHHSAP